MFYFVSTLKRISGTVCLFLLSFLCLYLIFDTIEHVRILLAYRADIMLLFKLAIFHLPVALYQLLPVALLIGSTYVMVEMSANHELIILLASGQSFKRRIAPFIFISLIFSVLMILWGDLIVPQSEKLYRHTIDIQIKHKDTWGNKYRPDRLWFSGPSGVWRVNKQEAGKYYGIDLHVASDDGNIGRYKADSMLYRNGKWSFVGLRYFEPASGKYLSIDSLPFAILEGPTHFQMIWDTAEEMDITELSDSIKLRHLQGFDTSGYETSLYGRFAFPLLAFFLPFVALPLVWSRHSLLKPSKILAISIAVAICLCFFGLIKVIQSASYSGQFNPVTIMIVPLLAALIMSLAFKRYSIEGNSR